MHKADGPARGTNKSETKRYKKEGPTIGTNKMEQLYNSDNNE